MDYGNWAGSAILFLSTGFSSCPPPQCQMQSQHKEWWAKITFHPPSDELITMWYKWWVKQKKKVHVSPLSLPAKISSTPLSQLFLQFPPSQPAVSSASCFSVLPFFLGCGWQIWGFLLIAFLTAPNLTSDSPLQTVINQDNYKNKQTLSLRLLHAENHLWVPRFSVRAFLSFPNRTPQEVKTQP